MSVYAASRTDVIYSQINQVDLPTYHTLKHLSDQAAIYAADEITAPNHDNLILEKLEYTLKVEKIVTRLTGSCVFSWSQCCTPL